MNKMGDIGFIIEDGVDQMVKDHDMQKGEILNHINGYIDIHYPGAIEEYQDETSPIYFYGCLETFVKLYKKQIKELLKEK